MVTHVPASRSNSSDYQSPACGQDSTGTLLLAIRGHGYNVGANSIVGSHVQKEHIVGVIKRMTAKDGHVETKWDLDTAESVAEAEAIFKEAAKTSPIFMMKNAEGVAVQTQVREWDPKAQEYLIVLQAQGG